MNIVRYLTHWSYMILTCVMHGHWSFNRIIKSRLDHITLLELAVMKENLRVCPHCPLYGQC